MRFRNAIPRNQRESEARERALASLALMRREGLSLTAAARNKEVAPRTVKKYVGSAIRQASPRGHHRATTFDRIPRRLNMLTPLGTVPVTVGDSRTSSRVGEYMIAVRIYINSGDVSALAPFKKKSFQAGRVTYVFITDPAVLDQLADAGKLTFEGLYLAIGR